jgi:putative nucleotidyltransferase with HDIG domain
MQQYNNTLALLCSVSKNVMTDTQLPKLLDHIMLMAIKALKATAASILLIDEQTKELFFEAAKGIVHEPLLGMRLKVKSGIAYHVTQTGKSVIVNDVSQDERFNPAIDQMTGFITKSISCVPLMAGGERIGAIEIINKCDGSIFDEQDLELLTSLASTSALAINNERLHRVVFNSYINTIKTLSETIDARDPYTHGHSRRVTEYALMTGISLGLPTGDLKTIEYGGILHDIGKIGISDAILHNTSKVLTLEERNIIRSHPAIGAKIIADIDFLKDARALVLHHHERYDGFGYPDRMEGEYIPLGARILAVADSFDAMTTNRPYRLALTIEQAIVELLKNRNAQFCPLAVDAFIKSLHVRNYNTSGDLLLNNYKPVLSVCTN